MPTRSTEKAGCTAAERALRSEERASGSRACMPFTEDAGGLPPLIAKRRVRLIANCDRCVGDTPESI
jgi:hypothetical protein